MSRVKNRVILSEKAQNFLSLTFNSFYTQKLIYFTIKLEKCLKNVLEAHGKFLKFSEKGVVFGVCC